MNEPLTKKVINILKAKKALPEIMEIFKTFQKGIHREDISGGDIFIWNFETYFLIHIERILVPNNLRGGFSDINITFNITDGTWLVKSSKYKRLIFRPSTQSYHGGVDSFKGWLKNFLGQLNAIN